MSLLNGQHLPMLLSNMVQKTEDYGRFKLLPGNRPISERHVLQLEESVLTENLLHLQPIVVNENWEQIDGQHKFVVSERNSLPVYYIQQAGLGLKEALIFNILNRTWKSSDFLASYIRQGKPAYVALASFLKKYPKLTISAGVMLFCADSKKNGYLRFKEGKMEIKRANRAEMIADILYRLYEITGKKNEWMFSVKFVSALFALTLAPRFNKDVLFQKVTLSPMYITRAVKTRDYVATLLAVYNMRNKAPINLKGYQEYYKY